MNYIGQIGVGGIFAILVIREVLGFLKTRNGKKNGVAMSGALPKEYWQNTFREIVNEGLKEILAPLIQQHTQVLTDIRSQINSVALQLGSLVTMAEGAERREK
jgi:transposase-like protein